MSTTLVAGATGSLGRLVVAELLARGETVRVLSRRPDAARLFDGAGSGRIESARGDVLVSSSLPACVDGVDAVVSCVGASLDLYAWRDRLPYSRVDRDGNLALIDAASAAGCRCFVYVSVFATPPIEPTAYVQAHRAVERALAASSLDWRIVRPTGFFGFLDELVQMARRGFAPVIGDGRARSNPIDERDLAAVVAGAASSADRIVEAGGPDVLTRAEMALLAEKAVGRRVRIVHSPPGLWTASARALKRLQPRLSELFEFAAAVSTNDAVAPQRGRRRLEDHFREVAALRA